MNQNLFELMKSLQNSSTKQQKATNNNLEIINLDEEDDYVCYAKPNPSYSNNKENDYETNTLINPNSTTAEFKKYLDDLKKNYLEKLSFSCPSKSVTIANKASYLNRKNDFDLKSAENLSNTTSIVKRCLFQKEVEEDKNEENENENKSLNFTNDSVIFYFKLK
jgi:hypothetical protein